MVKIILLDVAYTWSLFNVKLGNCCALCHGAFIRSQSKKISVFNFPTKIIRTFTFSADVGGFFDNPDTELLVRWYQVRQFSSVLLYTLSIFNRGITMWRGYA